MAATAVMPAMRPPGVGTGHREREGAESAAALAPRAASSSPGERERHPKDRAQTNAENDRSRNTRRPKGERRNRVLSSGTVAPGIREQVLHEGLRLRGLLTKRPGMPHDGVRRSTHQRLVDRDGRGVKRTVLYHGPQRTDAGNLKPGLVKMTATKPAQTCSQHVLPAGRVPATERRGRDRTGRLERVNETSRVGAQVRLRNIVHTEQEPVPENRLVPARLAAGARRRQRHHGRYVGDNGKNRRTNGVRRRLRTKGVERVGVQPASGDKNRPLKDDIGVDEGLDSRTRGRRGHHREE